MSLQLTLANANYAAALDKWRDHKLGCPPCSQAQHTRKPDGMCRSGQLMYADWKLCERDLLTERRLARAPMPGQEALFSEDEVARRVKRGQGA